ncbi:Carbon monoxide dehydrogenase large chain [Dyadobacter sp. CECT 9275]|uniref:Carbon monoxide dehydrogenase large chain n=1 Tax=Dyadobacter helix TaxID=2822344 RepID=A0A916JBR7_9BACT|nr:molybdopterin-dependent oxidoreductase [Dyadobacter sp. CECT 9275]CAG4998475.1 Carbon monoxide dehydrogenase large chain [Dyadobacter sp. CECT 9275]
MIVTNSVNGKTCSSEVEPRTLLVDFLREELGLTGTKVGCNSGACGVCSVLVDGKTTKSCQILAVETEGQKITTIEGLVSSGELHPLQSSFWENFAVQNGFSTPGTIIALTELLNNNPEPSEIEIKDWLRGNLTRETGYEQVVASVLSAASKMAGKEAEGTQQSNGSYIGSSVKTRDTGKLVTGEGEFIADMELPGMLHAAILQSPVAHAVIHGIDTSEAEAMPGVVRVFTAKDTGNVMPMPVIWIPPFTESHFLPHPSGIVPGSHTVFATDRVRFAGDQLAAVVAETRQQAYDALAKIKVDYEALPLILDAEEATLPGAPQLHETAPNNIMIHTIFGDKDATDQAIDESEVVVEQRIYNQRMMHNTLEVRGVIGRYDAATQDYTLWANTQIPFPHRLLISLYVLGIPYNKLRVIVPFMGESNGCKGNLYPDTPLVLWMAKELGRPVKWVDTRAGFARNTAQSRDQIQHIKIAGTAEGKLTALSCLAYSNVGAYPVINAPGQPLALIGRSITGAYVIPHSSYEVNVVYTNKVPTAPMRGSGRAEAIFLIERAIEMFARKIGKDPAEVRRMNMVQPDQFPFENGLGWTYDSGEYATALDMALDKAGYATLEAQKQEARSRGKLLGLGIGSYVAVAGVGNSGKMGGEGLMSGTWGSAYIHVAPSGEVAITTGAQPHGQSQQTTFAQIAAQELQIPMDYVIIKHSDTANPLYYGQASYGSRSLSVEGVAVQKACQMVIKKAKEFAAYLFKMPIEMIEYKEGKVIGIPAPDQAVMTLQQVALMLWFGWDLPEGMDPGLEGSAYFDPKNFNFPFGTHVAIVEIDEETCEVDLVKYIAVDDFGVVINPEVVKGQTYGNIVLGIGQALAEEAKYSPETGQVLSDDLDTYTIPRADWLPKIELYRTETPSPSNPLGVKGAGDVSNPPVAPAMVNAICDALSDFGVTHIDMPVTPEKIWEILRTETVTA